ncbi:MAG: hypothetical protein ACYCVG_11880, partial [Leptospirillum sp.]
VQEQKRIEPFIPPWPHNHSFPLENESIEAPIANHSIIQVYLRGEANSNQIWINLEKSLIFQDSGLIGKNAPIAKTGRPLLFLEIQYDSDRIWQEIRAKQISRS